MPVPRKIHNSRSERSLTIVWQNGEQSILGHQQLRAACRCAGCRGQVLDDRIFVVDESLVVEKVHAMHQGLQLVFSDGHERGIFPWGYLLELGGVPPHPSPLPQGERE